MDFFLTTYIFSNLNSYTFTTYIYSKLSRAFLRGKTLQLQRKVAIWGLGQKTFFYHYYYYRVVLNIYTFIRCIYIQNRTKELLKKKKFFVHATHHSNTP